MKLYIKNMVCDRCKIVVKTELEKLGFNPVLVQLGEVEIDEKSLNDLQSEEIKTALSKFGFEVLADRKEKIAAQIKALIIELVHYAQEPLHINLSAFLSDKLNLDYSNLSSIFSETEHQTIEKYFIQQKIEKVKELLAYGEKSLSEIAFLLNYSSVAHLSAQFKKIICQTPTAFKESKNILRRNLDAI